MAFSQVETTMDSVTNITQENVKEAVEVAILDWGNMMQAVQADGLTFGNVVLILLLICMTLALAGGILIGIMEAFKPFTSDATDIVLEDIQDWIKTYIVALPVRVYRKLLIWKPRLK